jgi:hypothetical protein
MARGPDGYTALRRFGPMKRRKSGARLENSAFYREAPGAIFRIVGDQSVKENTVEVNNAKGGSSYSVAKPISGGRARRLRVGYGHGRSTIPPK